jgi:hypothetical protein
MGKPSAELIRQSLRADDTGAVPAYADGNLVWQYVYPSDVEQTRRTEHVITVYVEERPRHARTKGSGKGGASVVTFKDIQLAKKLGSLT